MPAASARGRPPRRIARRPHPGAATGRSRTGSSPARARLRAAGAPGRGPARPTPSPAALHHDRDRRSVAGAVAGSVDGRGRRCQCRRSWRREPALDRRRSRGRARMPRPAGRPVAMQALGHAVAGHRPGRRRMTPSYRPVVGAELPPEPTWPAEAGASAAGGTGPAGASTGRGGGRRRRRLRAPGPASGVRSRGAVGASGNRASPGGWAPARPRPGWAPGRLRPARGRRCSGAGATPEGLRPGARMRGRVGRSPRRAGPSCGAGGRGAAAASVEDGTAVSVGRSGAASVGISPRADWGSGDRARATGPAGGGRAGAGSSPRRWSSRIGSPGVSSMWRRPVLRLARRRGGRPGRRSRRPGRGPLGPAIGPRCDGGTASARSGPARDGDRGLGLGTRRR